MESQMRTQLPYGRTVPDFHNRHVSSCSSSSSSYASSDENMLPLRHTDNNNLPKQLDSLYYGSSHVNRAYHHEERSRPVSTVSSSESELAELERDSSYLRQVSHRLKGSTCSNCSTGSGNIYPGPNQAYSQTSYRGCQQSEPCMRESDEMTSIARHQFSSQVEVMHGRPLPLTPEGELRAGGATTPLRYQNDSPFVSGARTLTNLPSPNAHKRSMTSSPSAPANQSAAEKQRSAEELLKQVPWFKPKMSRELVLESLAKEDLGSFIIRESSTHSTCFALSVKVPKFNNPTGIAHYIIHRTPSQGFKIKGLEKEWSNLSSLVIHHTIMPELLPCTLKIPPPISSRCPSSVSRRSNSSRGSSNSASPVLNTSAAPSVDKLAQGLERRLNVTNCEGVV